MIFVAEDVNVDGSDTAAEEIHKYEKKSVERRIAHVEEILRRFQYAPHRMAADAKDTASALENLEHGKHFLLQVISNLEKNNPRQAATLVHSLEFITHGFFAGLSRASVSESGLRYAQLARAEDARQQKKLSPREVLIDAEIEKAHIKHPDLLYKPFKIAGKIENNINQALRNQGHKAISIDALGKRISRKTPS